MSVPYLETSDETSVFSGLALVVVEVGRHGDDSARDRLAQMRLGHFLQLHENLRGDLGRREALAKVRLHPRVAIRGAYNLERHLEDEGGEARLYRP